MMGQERALGQGPPFVLFTWEISGGEPAFERRTIRLKTGFQQKGQKPEDSGLIFENNERK